VERAFPSLSSPFPSIVVVHWEEKRPAVKKKSTKREEEETYTIT
jgi:hypothetical protein